MNAQHYTEKILSKFLLLCVDMLKAPPPPPPREERLFFSNTIPPHTANVTKNYLPEKNCSSLDWPPCSPDLKLIEISGGGKEKNGFRSTKNS